MLIHGLPESSDSWEKREETLEKFRKVAVEDLPIDPNSTRITDIHHLPSIRS